MIDIIDFNEVMNTNKTTKIFNIPIEFLTKWNEMVNIVTENDIIFGIELRLCSINKNEILISSNSVKKYEKILFDKYFNQFSIIVKNKGIENNTLEDKKINIIPIQTGFIDYCVFVSIFSISPQLPDSIKGIIQLICSTIKNDFQIIKKYILPGSIVSTLFKTSINAFTLTAVKDGRFIEVNDSFCKIYGHTKDDVIGKTSVDLKLWPDDMSRNKVLQKLKTDGFLYKEPIITLHKYGEIIHVEFSANIIHYFDDEYILTEISNVTKNVAISTELEKSEERYRILFQMSSDPVFLIDKSTAKIIEINEAVTKIYGYSKEEALSMRNVDFSAEPDKTYKALQTKATSVLLRWHKKKDGAVFPVEITGSNFTWKGKDIQIAVCRDITDRLNAEKLLRDYERIFNLSLDPICTTSFDGTFLIVSPAFTNVLGYETHELTGKNVKDIICEEDKQKTIQYIRDELKNKSQRLSIENRYKRKDGNIVWLSWISQPIYNEEISISIAHDITKLKLAEIEILKAKEQAEKSDRLKTAFLCNMSHEIRTPMNGIVGFADILNQPDLSPDKRLFYSNVINESSQQLLQIVNDIIDISKIETGQVELHIKKTCINTMMNDIFSFFITVAQNKNIRLSIHTPNNDGESTIKTDPVKLRQIFDNLLSNAIKFTDQGTIQFGYAIYNNTMRFFVKDSGIGIDEKFHKMIFDPFRQTEDHETRKYGGTGLGLSISKAYVEKLKGKIWLKSSPGEGSDFYFELPYDSVSETTNNKNQVQTEEAIIIHKPIILIVEDEYINYLFLKEILKKVQAEILYASDGKEAIYYIKTRADINLVFMDIKLPEKNGYDITREIIQIRPELPVIAQTAYAMAGDKEKAFRAGCADYLSKPIKPNDVLKMVQKYI